MQYCVYFYLFFEFWIINSVLLSQKKDGQKKTINDLNAKNAGADAGGIPLKMLHCGQCQKS